MDMATAAEKKSILRDKAFKKYWTVSQELEPNDQVIDAYLAGRGSKGKISEIDKEKIIQEYLEEVRENYRNESKDFVNQCTNIIIPFFETIRKESKIDLFMKIESHDFIQFLCIIHNEEYFESNWKELYEKSSEIENVEIEAPLGSFIIRFVERKKIVSIPMIQDDGFNFSFVDA